MAYLTNATSLIIPAFEKAQHFVCEGPCSSAQNSAITAIAIASLLFFGLLISDHWPKTMKHDTTKLSPAQESYTNALASADIETSLKFLKQNLSMIVDKAQSDLPPHSSDEQLFFKSYEILRSTLESYSTCVFSGHIDPEMLKKENFSSENLQQMVRQYHLYISEMYV